MENIFFSKDNFNILFSLINNHLFLDKGYDSKPFEQKINNIINNSREYVLKENIEKVSKMIGNDNQKITALNKTVLKNAVPQVNQLFNEHNIHKGNNIKRERDVTRVDFTGESSERGFNTRKNGELNDRMEKLKENRDEKRPVKHIDFRESENQFTNVNNTYEKMMKERDQTPLNNNQLPMNTDKLLKPEPPNTDIMPSLNQVNNDTLQPFSSFNNSLDSFSEFGKTDMVNTNEKDDRYSDILENLQTTNEIKPANNNTNENNISNFTKTYSSLNQERQDTENSVRLDIIESDPKRLYDNMLGKTNLNKLDVVPTRTENFMIKQDKSNNISVKNYILINGSDREWYGYWDDNNKYISPTEINRYNFTVRFGDDDTNSLNIIKTMYNVSKVELDNAYIVKGDNQNDIRFLPENSVDIMGKNVYISINKDITSYPYMILSINELNQNNATTSKNKFSYFTNLDYLDDLGHDNTQKLYLGEGAPYEETIIGRNYIKLESKHESIYYNHIQKLDRMTINLLKPDGEKYFKNVNETIYIKEINHSKNDTWQNNTIEYITLEFNNSVDKSQFHIGDRIIAKNLKFLTAQYNNMQANTSKHNNLVGYTEFMDFLNRDEGHIVMGLGTKNIDSNIKMIESINIPLEYSIIDPIANNHTGFLNNGVFARITNTNNHSWGQILNKTLQISLAFTITTEEFRIGE